jgi:Spy/CpxP family protein refolding chaperone
MKAAKTLLLVAIAAVLIVSVAIAQEQPTRPGAGGTGGGAARMGMGMMNRSPVRMIIMMKDQLKLTDEQVTKLEAIKPADPNAAQKAQQKLTEVQRDLNAAVMAADEAKIKELCPALGKATEATSLIQAAEYKQIKQILTADQFKELQTLMTRGAGRMGGGMGGTRGTGGAGGPGAGGSGGPPNQN